MNDVDVFSLTIIITGFLFVKIASNVLKFDDYAVKFKNPRKSALASLLVILINFFIVIFNCLYTSKCIMGTKYIFISYFLQLIPVILVCYFQHDTLQSIGITRKNLLKSILLELGLVAILFLTVHLFIKPNGAYYSISQKVSLLISYLIVGFSEEVVFRGYLQTRLIAWIGKMKGMVLTAMIFSLTHLPSLLIFQHLNFINALINSFELIPIALLQGYIMLKTRNIVAPTIFHAVLDWIDQVIIFTF